MWVHVCSCPAVPWAWREAGVTQISHLGLSTLRSLPLSALTGCGSPYSSSSTTGRSLSDESWETHQSVGHFNNYDPFSKTAVVETSFLNYKNNCAFNSCISGECVVWRMVRRSKGQQARSSLEVCKMCLFLFDVWLCECFTYELFCGFRIFSRFFENLTMWVQECPSLQIYSKFSFYFVLVLIDCLERRGCDIGLNILVCWFSALW